MSRSRSVVRAAALLFAFAFAPVAAAQVLPVAVDVAGDTATLRIGAASAPLADVTLVFDDATGLTAANLGVTAQLVPTTATALLARLPTASLTSLDSALPLLLTIEPPAGGLSFRRTVRVEVHTHALVYTAGSPFRLFKAPLGGAFRDITEDVSPGSVRARGNTGGFSEFLLLADLRPYATVTASKFTHLRGVLATVSPLERAPLVAMVDDAEAAVAEGDHALAIATLDQLRARVSERAGIAIPQVWTAGSVAGNPAGELLSGASTLKFSIAQQRDYGP